MNEEEKEKIIRKILVALDTSPHSEAALRAAIDLAAHLDADLVGLFVEDIQLIQMADFTLARQVGQYSAVSHTIDRQQVERELRAQANHARRMLQTLSGGSNLRTSFRVTRGLIAAELIQAANEVDILILGKSGWSRRRHLGSTARQMITDAPKHILIIQQGSPLQLPLGIIFDGTSQSQKALEVGAVLAQEAGENLLVALLAHHTDQAQQMHDEVETWLHERNLQARFRWLVAPGAGMLAHILHNFLQMESLGVLVLPAVIEKLPGATLMEILNESTIPVLVVK